MAGFTEAIVTLAMTEASEASVTLTVSAEASVTFAVVVNVELFMSIMRERFRRMTAVAERARTVARDMATMSFTVVNRGEW